MNSLISLAVIFRSISVRTIKQRFISHLPATTIPAPFPELIPQIAKSEIMNKQHAASCTIYLLLSYPYLGLNPLQNLRMSFLTHRVHFTLPKANVSSIGDFMPPLLIRLEIPDEKDLWPC